MSSQRLVFRNGFVVSMDPDIGEIPNGEVLVEDGVIVDVGPDLGVSDAEEIDATGMIVMPGFVDTHRHTWQTPVRGVLPCCTLDHYFAVMLGQRRRPLPPRGRPHRQLRRLARGDQRRRDDAARLVAHQQHARPLGCCGAGPEGRRHPRRSTRTACRRAASGGRSASSTIRRTSAASARPTSRPTTGSSRSPSPRERRATRTSRSRSTTGSSRATSGSASACTSACG